MKNIINNLFAALLFLFASVACDKIEPVSESGHKIAKLEASINSNKTKTLLGEGIGDPVSFPVLWSKGDEIAVINNGKLFKFTIDSTDAGKSSATFISTEAEGFDPAMDIFAYYPYSSITSFDETQLNINVPSVQTYTTNNVNGNICSSFSVGAAPMLCYRKANNTETLLFDNLFGVLKLQLTGSAGEKISKIEVMSNIEPYGTSISGPAQIAYKNDEHAVYLSGTELANKSVVLDCSSNPVQLSSAPVEFLITLPPNNHDLTIIFTDSNGNRRVVRTVATKTVTAGSIIKLPVVSYTPASGEYIVTEINGKKSYYGAGVVIDGASWAPINCGYEPATSTSRGYTWGKYYQWGRQYGQGYCGEVTCSIYPYPTSYDETYPSVEDGTVIRGTVSLVVGQDSENRHTYIAAHGGLNQYGRLFHNDWLDEHMNDLWNKGTEESPVKGLYDPCPEGWRVPSHIELTSLSTNAVGGVNNGQAGCWASGSIKYSESVASIFLPASGLINGIYSEKEAKLNIYYDDRNFNTVYVSSTGGTGESGDGMLVIHPPYTANAASSRNVAYPIRCIRE